MEKGKTLLVAKAERVGTERTGKGKGHLVIMRNEEGSYTTGKSTCEKKAGEVETGGERKLLGRAALALSQQIGAMPRGDGDAGRADRQGGAVGKSQNGCLRHCPGQHRRPRP